METSVEAKMPSIKNNVKEDIALEENKFNPPSWQELQGKIEKPVEKIDKPLENVKEAQDKIDKSIKILIFSCGDKTQDKIKKLQKKIKKTQEKIDKQKEKIKKRQEKFDKPLEKTKEPQEINEQQEKLENPQQRIDKTQEKIDKLQEKIKRTQEKIEKFITNKEECNQDAPCCATCRYAKSKTRGSDKPGLRCKKTRRGVVPSVSSLNQSVSYNCRNCCCMLGELCKEVHGTIKGDSNARLCEVLEELSDTILAIANDCVVYVRRIGIDTRLMICRVVRRTHAKVYRVVRRSQQYGRMATGKVSAVANRTQQYATMATEKVSTIIDTTQKYAANAKEEITNTIRNLTQCQTCHRENESNKAQN